MNMFETHREGSILEVKIPRNFNLWVKNMIENRLGKEVTQLIVDLTRCKIVDSEAVIFMYEWQNNGHTLILVNPPEIFFEIVDILELENEWQLNVSKTNAG